MNFQDPEKYKGWIIEGSTLATQSSVDNWGLQKAGILWSSTIPSLLNAIDS